MKEIVKKLTSKCLAHPPKWLPENTHYLVQMGSRAYSCENSDSDYDIYGWCMPPKGIIFPHESGVVLGFDKNYETFNNWQEHHIKYDGKEYGFDIYNIVRYFRLVADNNPNMVDSLFVPGHCIFYMSSIGSHVRNNRKLFLSKKAYHTFHGYAYQQLHKMSKKEKLGEKRAGYINDFGFDVKYAYHLVRLTEECKQILEEGDLDLGRKNELYKAIRRGDWTEDKIRNWYSEQEKYLENLYRTSNLQNYVDEVKIKSLLLECLEMHYGSLHNTIKTLNKHEIAIEEIKNIVGRL